jgi:Predicted pPIWI-associating nuclease
MTIRETTKQALEIAKKISHDSGAILEIQSFRSINRTSIDIERKDIYLALSEISQKLGDSYLQAKQDIKNADRISWAGTAHEIREVLATLLRTLAPDNEVKSQPWYKQESDRPTQKQRVRYILQKRGSSSTQREVTEKIDILDEMLGELVRSTYSRASDAAHTYEPRKEVKRLLGYFEAFAHDLLDL